MPPLKFLRRWTHLCLLNCLSTNGDFLRPSVTVIKWLPENRLLIWLASPCWIITKHAKCHTALHVALIQREKGSYKPMLYSHSDMNPHTQFRCTWVCSWVTACERWDLLCLRIVRKRIGTDWLSAVTSLTSNDSGSTSIELPGLETSRRPWTLF